MDNTKTTLRFMRSESTNHIDAITGEPNFTGLAEATALHFDHDEWLDDPDHAIWQWAIDAFGAIE